MFSRLAQNQSFPSINRIVVARMLNLDAVLHVLDTVAPCQLSASWDNTGLLIEPAAGSSQHRVTKVLVTNDLTPSVFDEAKRQQASLVYSYHPLLFRPIKKLTSSSGWTTRVALSCVRNDIAVYSPHTAIDAVCGGNNDWLLDSFSKFGITKRKVLEPVAAADRVPEFGCSDTAHFVSLVKNSIGNLPTDAKVLKQSKYGHDLTLTTIAHKNELQNVGQVVYSRRLSSPSKTGYGRFAELNTPIESLDEAVRTIKQRIGVDRLRVVRSPRNHSMIGSVAVCAGSGSGVFGSGQVADLLVTGELAHHDSLAAAAAGSHVILCEHSRSERDFLRSELTSRLQQLFDGLSGSVQVAFAGSDDDPVTIM